MRRICCRLEGGRADSGRAGRWPTLNPIPTPEGGPSKLRLGGAFLRRAYLRCRKKHAAEGTTLGAWRRGFQASYLSPPLTIPAALARTFAGSETARRVAKSMQTPTRTVDAASSPVSSFVISWVKRIDLSLISCTEERIVIKSPAHSSRLYAICCSTAAIPRPSFFRREADNPSFAISCQVASSNFPTYHITFMWPM